MHFGLVRERREENGRLPMMDFALLTTVDDLAIERASAVGRKGKEGKGKGRVVVGSCDRSRR